MKKTNAQRSLEAQGVPYAAVEYDATGAFHSADEVAHLLGVPVASIFKSLVVLREPPRGKPILVMVPADRELDLRTFARAIGEKKLRMAKEHEAEVLTGLRVGGISALALLNRGFAIYIDAAAQDHDEIHVSGGVRGLDLKLRVVDLIKITNAAVVDLARNG